MISRQNYKVSKDKKWVSLSSDRAITSLIALAAAVPYPNLSQAVFVRVRRNCGPVTLPE